MPDDNVSNISVHSLRITGMNYPFTYVYENQSNGILVI